MSSLSKKTRLGCARIKQSILILTFLTVFTLDGSAFVGDEKFNGTNADPAEIWFEEPNIPLLAETDFTLNIRVGTPALPVSGLFGLSFELHYSSDKYLELIEPMQAASGSFLEPDTYTFTRHEPENKVLYLAVSRKRGALGQDGFGTVLTIPLKVAADINGGWQTCFILRNVSAQNSQGDSISLRIGEPLCISGVVQSLEVIPNPFTPNGDSFNDVIEWRKEAGFPADWSVSIMDRVGRLVKKLENGENTWDGKDEQNRDMLPGTYLYLVRSKTEVIQRGLMWLIL